MVRLKLALEDVNLYRSKLESQVLKQVCTELYSYVIVPILLIIKSAYYSPTRIEIMTGQLVSKSFK